MRKTLYRAAIPLIAFSVLGLAMPGSHNALAQDSNFQDETNQSLAANPADVASVDAIMDAVYDVISGPAGAPRDWDRFLSLFIDGARLIPRSETAPGGVSVSSPNEYVTRASANFAENGFFESEIHRTAEQYGDIVHAFSTYEARREENAEPFLRGINSFQLLYHDERWWIVTIYWQAETPDNPLPEKYLP